MRRNVVVISVSLASALTGCGGSDDDDLSPRTRARFETIVREISDPRKVRDATCEKEGNDVRCKVLFASGRCEVWSTPHDDKSEGAYFRTEACGGRGDETIERGREPVDALGRATPVIERLVYVADCGNTGYLAFKPRDWSNGCTAGADNVRGVKWRTWSSQSARGTGTAVLRVMDCSPNEGYDPASGEPPAPCIERKPHRTPARVRFYRVRECTSERGTKRLYFSRVRFEAYFDTDNPFGHARGWHERTYKVDDSTCTLERF